MGSQRNCVFITYIIVVFVFNVTRSFENGSSPSYNHDDSLNSFLYNYALDEIHRPQMGKLYRVSLPGNLSGVEMSFSRVKANRIWRHGFNDSSYFSIPQCSYPCPATKRVDIISYNLGNSSRSYFDVANHTLVAPTLGLFVYDHKKNHNPIELALVGESSVVVRFQNVSRTNGMECVRFDKDGTLEFSNVTLMESTWSCAFRKVGHFSIVVPSDDSKFYRTKGKCIINRRRNLTGIVVGGLFVLGMIVAVVVVVGRRRRNMNKKMESMSELSVALDTIWVGKNKIAVRI